MGVFHLQLENAAKKRERTTSDPKTAEQKQEKKRLKISKKSKDPDLPENNFTPYDYSKSDFKAFAGEARSGAQKECLAMLDGRSVQRKISTQPQIQSCPRHGTNQKSRGTAVTRQKRTARHHPLRPLG